MLIRHAPFAALLAFAVPVTATAQNTHDHDSHSTTPDSSSHPDHTGHAAQGDLRNWNVMTHAVLTFVADSQQGPRGGDKSFIQGMAMLTAQRPLGDRNDLILEAMVSPDPFMGKSGYPLLLQTGETADGVHHLVDRQHPHDLIMGLTATVTHRFDSGAKASIMVGYPGEFAFGPTAFMHRKSGENFPTAPISHHWLDSGHITMGVVTAGLETGPVKLEVSQFTGREPDEQRFDLDPVKLNSTSVRGTWQVTPALTAQASWARQVSPEQLHPDENAIKTSLSLDYQKRFSSGTLNTTIAWARKEDEEQDHKAADAYLWENTFTFNGPWLGLLRHERVYNAELGPQPAWVAKTELGAVRTFALNDTTTLGIGVVQQFNSLPDSLEPGYGGDPQGTVAFMTLKFHNMPGQGMQGMSH